MRECVIRVKKSFQEVQVQRFINGLKQLPQLRRLVINCDSQYLTYFWSLVKDMDMRKVHVVFKLNWFREADCQDIEEVSNHATVGIYTNGLTKILDMFMKPNVSLLYYTNSCLQLSTRMTVEKRFESLLRLYFPFKLEIQGTDMTVTVPKESFTLDLSALDFLTELFLNEVKYTRQVRVVLPSRLKHLMINNVSSIAMHGISGVDSMPVAVAEKIRTQYGSLIE